MTVNGPSWSAYLTCPECWAWQWPTFLGPFLTLLRTAAISGTLSSSNSWSLPSYSPPWVAFEDYTKYLQAVPASWPGHVFDVGTAYVPLQQLSVLCFCLPTSRGAVLIASAQRERRGLPKLHHRYRKGGGDRERQWSFSSFPHSKDVALQCTLSVIYLPAFDSIETA